MNQLSQLLYLADLFEKANIAFFAFAAIGILLAFAFWLASLDAYDDDDTKVRKRNSVKAGIFGVIMTIIAVAIPGKTTMYAIAASEVGEVALKSETGTLATRALNAWLRKQVEEQPEEATE